MIKTITERSLHEVIQRMRAEGVSLKDTEGFGLNIDASGHVYVVYMGEESETGVIDTSAGEAGVSAWINPNPSAANPSAAVEIGEVATDVAYGAETLTYSSGSTWAVTLANAAGANGNYIKPRTFFVEATDTGPELTDDGLGNVILNDASRRRVGSINYNTGAVSITYFSQKLEPKTTSSPRIKYTYSPLPNSSVFPKVAALSHIVFVTDTGHKVDYALYNNEPSGNVYDAPVFFNNSGTTASQIAGSIQYFTEDFCDSRISICLNTTITDRQVRWMQFTSNAKVLAIYVYWNRLSS